MKQRLLLIEDEASLSVLLCERLEREGYSMTACKDGIQGLSQALSGAFDLLILDVRLPGRNGFKCATSCAATRSMCLSLC